VQRPPPLALVLGGVIALVVVLAVSGAFHRPGVFLLVAVLVVALIVGFVLARRPRR
jgi:hypothetical protein